MRTTLMVGLVGLVGLAFLTGGSAAIATEGGATGPEGEACGTALVTGLLCMAHLEACDLARELGAPAPPTCDL